MHDSVQRCTRHLITEAVPMLIAAATLQVLLNSRQQELRAQLEHKAESQVKVESEQQRRVRLPRLLPAVAWLAVA